MFSKHNKSLIKFAHMMAEDFPRMKEDIEGAIYRYEMRLWTEERFSAYLRDRFAGYTRFYANRLFAATIELV